MASKKGTPVGKKLAPISSTEPQEPIPVGRVPPRAHVEVGKPKRLAKTAGMKLAYNNVGMNTSNTIDASFGNFYSPELSTDFLELPQSRAEQWAYYRFFYASNPFVGQAIDLHTELPLSRVRLNDASAKSRDLSLAATRFCENWARRINLLQRLMSIVFEYHLIGTVYIFAEDTNPDIPPELLVEQIPSILIDDEGNPILDDLGNPRITIEERSREPSEEASAWMRKNYKGWTSIRCLPPEQVIAETFNFTDAKLIELVPDSKTRKIIQHAESGDVRAQRIVDTMPRDVVRAVREGTNIPLGTDPDAGSFVYCMENKKSDYAERGASILGRCILPGTPLTVLRDDAVIRVPVEIVDVKDLLLTHAGRFMPARGGSRPVNEDVVVVHCEGDIEGEHLTLTVEHPVLVVRPTGDEEWVAAGDLKVGDTLRESHVVSVDASSEDACDFVRWWQGRQISLDRRVRPNHLGDDAPSTRVAQVVDVCVDKDGVVVTFEYPQDDANRLHAVQVDQKVHAWLSGLQRPLCATAATVGSVLGLAENEVDCAVVRFRRDIPDFRIESEDQKTLWHPLPGGVPVPGEKEVRVLRSSITRFPLDEEMVYLLGAWFGDGCVWRAREEFLNARHVMWSCGEAPVRDRILKAASRLGAAMVGHLIPGNEEDAVEQVWIDDPLLARWFYDQFGHGADAKRIPAWLFMLDEALIFSFLRGVLDTDGCLSVIKNAASIHVVLDNRHLVDQLHLLCNRVGLHTSVAKNEKGAHEWIRTWKTKDGTRTKTYKYDAKTYWNLICSRDSDVRRWASGSVKGDAAQWVDRAYAWKSRFTVDGWLTRKVVSVARVPYEGRVYSFDVEGDESLVASGKVVHNCLRTLVQWDKLRQANSSIASRHMTPHRIVWAVDLDQADMEDLRMQVDLSLQDPDFSIIANYEIHWEEMGSDQRLLDLTSEMEMTNRELYAGLGVTEGLLTGESSYSGDKISLEVINTRYMLLRELLQDFVGEYLFKPMCRRMGFVEEDEDGNMDVIYPKLSFTRLAIRDNRDTFESLMNLYQKGSLDVGVILEFLNIDPISTKEKLERDQFGVNDALFNEVLRGLYGEAGRTLADPEKTNAVEKIASSLGLHFQRPKGPGRFDPQGG